MPPDSEHGHELLQPEVDFVRRTLDTFDLAFDGIDVMQPHEAREELKAMASTVDGFEFLSRPDARTAFVGSIVGGMIGAQVPSKRYYHDRGRPVLVHATQHDPGLMQLMDYKLEHAVSGTHFYQPGTPEKYQLQDAFLQYVHTVRWQVQHFDSESARSKSQADLFLLGVQFGASRPKYRTIYKEEIGNRLS